MSCSPFSVENKSETQEPAIWTFFLTPPAQTRPISRKREESTRRGFTELEIGKTGKDVQHKNGYCPNLQFQKLVESTDFDGLQLPAGLQGFKQKQSYKRIVPGLGVQI